MHVIEFVVYIEAAVVNAVYLLAETYYSRAQLWLLLLQESHSIWSALVSIGTVGYWLELLILQLHFLARTIEMHY
jgi:hypothetical protein